MCIRDRSRTEWKWRMWLAVRRLERAVRKAGSWGDIFDSVSKKKLEDIVGGAGGGWAATEMDPRGVMVVTGGGK